VRLRRTHVSQHPHRDRSGANFGSGGPRGATSRAITRRDSRHPVRHRGLEVERQWFTRVSQADIAFHRDFLAREEEAVSRELSAQIDRARSDQPLDVDTLVRQGRAPDEIAAVAAQRGCDLIVIGTRGRSETLGSVAEQVVRIAGRPVLVIPADPPR
jgi:nucleotide-binding universal stress UspA family protein